uniref:Calpain 6 n=1 Tax=Xenopus tropicalis TaxID=8364 RepID=F6WTS6_XENTR
MSSPDKQLKTQNYHELKKECIKNGKLFEDPEFPASDESLFYSKAPDLRIEWKRPKELCEDPHLFVDGISSHDLHQGRLGNCWFVAACSCLALKKALWTKVISNWKKQEWDPKRPHRYAGIFHFKFWCLGDWVDVVIDDRLPSVDGNLVYCHSNVKNEFWSALLEKAYAKLAGSYEALDGGNTADAIVDFTGAVTESFELDKGDYRTSLMEQTKLFQELLKVYRAGGLISCYIKPVSSNDMEAVTSYGLVKGHAYSVTAIKKMPVGQRILCFGNSNKLFMIRMRNPWGKREWKGAWSDESEEWNKVSRSEKATLGLTVADDGEFWMTFEDWCLSFTHADVCRILNTSYLSCYKTWKQEEVHGAWSKNTDPLLNRSGGCFNETTFFQNPQVELNREYRIHMISGQEKTLRSSYINLRAIFLRKVLTHGRYVIIPTTFHPGISSSFILRLFTDESSRFRELLLDKPKVSCWSLLCGYPQRVTQVLVRHVEGVERQGQMQEPNLYIMIKGEKQTIRSLVYKKTSTAKFDIQAIFFRKNISEPICIQVWDSRIICDQFLGQVLLAGSPTDSKEERRLQLHGRDSHGEERMPGHITIKVVSSDDLVEL